MYLQNCTPWSSSAGSSRNMGSSDFDHWTVPVRETEGEGQKERGREKRERERERETSRYVNSSSSQSLPVNRVMCPFYNIHVEHLKLGHQFLHVAVIRSVCMVPATQRGLQKIQEHTSNQITSYTESCKKLHLKRRYP